MRSQTSSPHPSKPTSAIVDFSFLLRPEIYHPLSVLTTPTAFRTSPTQPDPSTPLPSLLANGHFRAAAIVAAQQLTQPSTISPSDHAQIFYLVHVRLSCLILIGATTLAGQEVKALQDLSNTARYVDPATGQHLVPWDLRVLCVRLQAVGLSEPRRAVAGYHELAREARMQLARAKSEGEDGLEWTARLAELGIRVASALVEMGDPLGAACHLETLKNSDNGKLDLAKALVWLQIGNIEAATRCVQSTGAAACIGNEVMAALCAMAATDYSIALEKWNILAENRDDEMVGVNIAVCLLYLGRIAEVSCHEKSRSCHLC